MGAKPSVNRVDLLMYGDEAAAINNALNASDARLGSRSIFIHDANGCRQISVRYIVAAEVLERCIGVNGLIVSIAVDQGSRLIHQCFFEQRDNRLTARSASSSDMKNRAY